VSQEIVRVLALRPFAPDRLSGRRVPDRRRIASGSLSFVPLETGWVDKDMQRGLQIMIDREKCHKALIRV